MIIVQLKGGLGNQLFQYAAGLSLSRHHNVPVKVDTRELKLPDKLVGTSRYYELQNLINPPLVATKEEVESVIEANTFQNFFQKLLPSYKRSVYNEKKFGFDKNFFRAGVNIYVKGYRQSEKYFVSIKDEIAKSFQFKRPLISDVLKEADKISKVESVSIHIRRGDYHSTAAKDYHGTLSRRFYRAAMNRISSSIANPTFYVFSDNIEWAQNLDFESPVHFVSHRISSNHYHDFYLMQSCRHNIIANSSFSWWAAWLNPNPGKVVIAPDKWFNNAPLDTTDLIPEKWIKL